MPYQECLTQMSLDSFHDQYGPMHLTKDGYVSHKDLSEKKPVDRYRRHLDRHRKKHYKPVKDSHYGDISSYGVSEKGQLIGRYRRNLHHPLNIDKDEDELIDLEIDYSSLYPSNIVSYSINETPKGQEIGLSILNKLIKERGAYIKEHNVYRQANSKYRQRYLKLIANSMYGSMHNNTGFMQTFSDPYNDDLNLAINIALGSEHMMAPICDKMMNHVHTISVSSMNTMIECCEGKGHLHIDNIANQIKSYNKYINSVTDNIYSKSVMYDYIKYVNKNVSTFGVNKQKYHYIVSNITDDDVVIYKGNCNENCFICKNNLNCDEHVISLTNDIYKSIRGNDIEIII
jgi:hypothetical protein